MGDDCGGCRKWEEDIYWSHFQTVQFCQTLPSGYHQQLAVPQKFANNLREKLAGVVSLKGPSGTLWNVEVIAGGDTLVFKGGWKEFVEDHSLEENDVLIFKYSGESRFDVLMFDKESCCEKESSYFVKRCGHTTDVNTGCKNKGTSSECFEVANESSHGAVDFVPSKRPRSNAAMTSKPTEQCPQADKIQSSGKRTTAYPLQMTSNRRPVTMQEKEKALQMAHSASSEGSFLVIMQPSHVYKTFYMSIPIDWIKKYLPVKTRMVTLRFEERNWLVTFHRRFSNNNGGFTVGWKKFVLDNFLEESDVCLFKPASKTPEAMVMDVSIFRVVKEVIPPSLVTPLSGRGRNRNLAARMNQKTDN